MSERIKITRVETLSDKWVKLTKTEFDYKRSGGNWQSLAREVHDHGNAAAVLLLDPKQRTIVLVRQFRLPVLLNGYDGWLTEVVAGLLDGDEPEICAIREAEEESGYKIQNIRFAFQAFMSPGAVTERVDLFVAEYDARSKVSKGGGLEEEGEDIEVIEINFDDALKMIETGEIADAKTIMLLQYAALNNLV